MADLYQRMPLPAKGDLPREVFRYRFTDHAEGRLKERGISKDEIYSAICLGEATNRRDEDETEYSWGDIVVVTLGDEGIKTVYNRNKKPEGPELFRLPQYWSRPAVKTVLTPTARRGRTKAIPNAVVRYCEAAKITPGKFFTAHQFAKWFVAEGGRTKAAHAILAYEVKKARVVKVPTLKGRCKYTLPGEVKVNSSTPSPVGAPGLLEIWRKEFPPGAVFTVQQAREAAIKGGRSGRSVTSGLSRYALQGVLEPVRHSTYRFPSDPGEESPAPPSVPPPALEGVSPARPGGIRWVEPVEPVGVDVDAAAKEALKQMITELVRRRGYWATLVEIEDVSPTLEFSGEVHTVTREGRQVRVARFTVREK